MSKNTNYVVKRSEGYSDELQHWNTTGFKKEDHKYIDRKMVNGKWVYTYPEDVAKTNKVSVKPQFNTQKSQFQPIQRYSQVKAQQNNDANAAAAAARQSASIKRTQTVQARNNRINEAAEAAANRNNEALSGAKRKAIIESNRFKVGKEFGSDLGSVVRNNISKVTGKEDRERKYIRETMGESAARGYDDATNIGKIAKRTVKKADKALDNARDAVQDKVSDAKSAATKAVKTATEKAAKRRKKVSKAINNTVKSAKKHVDKGRDWLDGLFD